MDLPNLKEDFRYKQYGDAYSSFYKVFYRGKLIGFVHGHSYGAGSWIALDTTSEAKAEEWRQKTLSWYKSQSYKPKFKVSDRVKRRSLAALELLKLQGKIQDSPDYLEKVVIVDTDLITRLDDVILRAEKNPAEPDARPAIQGTARIISKGGTSLRKLTIFINPEIPEATTTTGKKLKIANLEEVLSKVFSDGKQ